MRYVQVWIKVDDDGGGLHGPVGAADEPIKRPCWQPGTLLDELGISNSQGLIADEATKRLGLESVQSPQPVVFIEDSGVWSALLARAESDGVTVAAVLSAAVEHYTAAGPH